MLGIIGLRLAVKAAIGILAHVCPVFAEWIIVWGRPRHKATQSEDKAVTGGVLADQYSDDSE